uniref:Uncharacterized protein n=1 Tax=Rhizophora mucronata TaxID=61149 RepID=A0A2P2KUV3_RHIMU
MEYSVIVATLRYVLIRLICWKKLVLFYICCFLGYVVQDLLFLDI